MANLTTASGHGIATITNAGAVLDVWYPKPALSPIGSQDATSSVLSALVGIDDLRGVSRELVTTEINLDDAPQDAKDAYLRLHILSHRLVKPHGLSLDGIFG